MSFINKLILTLMILVLIGQESYSQDSDFESFLKIYIDKAIANGQINQDPLIVIQGLPIDSTNRKDMFSILVKSDVKALKVLESKIAIELYDTKAKNGALLVVCNKQGKKKIRNLYKNKDGS